MKTARRGEGNVNPQTVCLIAEQMWSQGHVELSVAQGPPRDQGANVAWGASPTAQWTGF